MQVSVESTSDLGRKVKVIVPESEVLERVQAKLKELTKTVKMHGFRPGKVPLTVVEKRYGSAVKQEVVGDLLQKTLYDALTQEKLNPAGMPKIDSIKSEDNQPLEYEASFEEYPSIELKEFKDFTFDVFNADITPADIEKMTDSIRKQHCNWTEVERAAKNEDQLKIDFKGTMDGEEFQGGSAEDVSLELGSNSFIPGFEEKLVGVLKGDEKVIDLTFPEDYQAKELAGKAVQFAVTVKAVMEASLPELNDEFATKMGITEGGIEKFHGNVKQHMERELENTLKNKQKSEIFDKLLEAHNFQTPQALIDQEAESMIRSMMQQYQQKADTPIDLDKVPAQIKEEAARRVSIGLLVAEIIKKNNLHADPQKVRAFLEEMAKAYEQPEQLISYYYNDKQRLASIEAMVLEESVMENVLEAAQANQVNLSYDEIMAASNAGTGR